MRLSNVLIATTIGLFVVSAGSERAEACGGTFCDTGPQAMPVDQTGENILFVLDGQNVEAHVQIQYQGSAERFAWIVPMPDVPDVSVGSQLFFQNLLQATVPTYGYQTQPDFCGGSGGGGGFSAGGSGGAGGGIAMDGGGGGPQVVYEKTVGAFEVVVLKGGTATEVVDWLGANNYQNIPAAPQILQDYVAKNYVFVAIKLTAGAGLDQIHPLVFKYAGNAPCVPLKLTRVAATEDMGVRAFFLGDDRVVPTNYKHVELNPVRVDWQAFGSNYVQAVGRSADSAVANGKAFVTEYAGASSAVSPTGAYSANWNSAAFQTILPEKVIDELTTQGLVVCTSPSYCVFNHPLVLPLLHQYLPVPAGYDDATFYSCLECNKALIDATKWNAFEFAADFKLRIEDPGAHVKDLLLKWPYLTRLFTTISPAEMTEDPEFHAQTGLDTVNPTHLGKLRVTCSSQRGMILPDAREVALDGLSWPAWDSLMPWAEKIEEYQADGTKLTLVDNTDKINALLADWNQKHAWPPAGGTGGTSGVGGSGSGGKPGSGGAANDLQASGGGGCTLATGSPFAGPALLLGALGLVLARRRRIRRRGRR